MICMFFECQVTFFFLQKGQGCGLVQCTIMIQIENILNLYIIFLQKSMNVRVHLASMEAV